MSSRTAKLLGTVAALACGVVVLGLPGWIKRGRQRRSSVDGVVTLSDAVNAYRRTGLTGWSNREMADALGTREGTIKNHISSVLFKLGVRDRIRAVLRGLELGLV
jgi:DNA-binding CsgD family transcriptional regulator